MVKLYRHDERNTRVQEVVFTFRINDKDKIGWLSNNDWLEIDEAVKDEIAYLVKDRAERNIVKTYFSGRRL